MCNPRHRFPPRRITNFQFSPVVVALFIPPSSPLSPFCFRFVNPAIVAFSESATWRLASRVHMIPPGTNDIPLRENPFKSFFLRNQIPRFDLSALKNWVLSSFFSLSFVFLFLIFLHGGRANWNSNDTFFFWTFKNSYQNVWKNCRHCYLELSFWSWIETLILELEISSKDISNERK